MAPADRLRLTSRIVVMDPEGSVLLFNTAAPDSSGFSRWITPGGGVDPGETHLVAAERELFEETGQKRTIGPEPVWTYHFDVAWDQADHNRGYAEYFLIQAERFEPISTFWTPEEHVDVTGWHWFSVEELESGADPYEPVYLPTLIRECHALL